MLKRIIFVGAEVGLYVQFAVDEKLIICTDLSDVIYNSWDALMSCWENKEKPNKNNQIGKYEYISREKRNR